MSEEFVRKDYHDATMREIKALMEQNLAKQETLITDIRGEIRNIHTRIDGVVEKFSVEIADIKDRISDVRQNQSDTFAKWGITVAIIVRVVQVTLTLLLK